MCIPTLLGNVMTLYLCDLLLMLHITSYIGSYSAPDNNIDNYIYELMYWSGEDN